MVSVTETGQDFVGDRSGVPGNVVERLIWAQHFNKIAERQASSLERIQFYLGVLLTLALIGVVVGLILGGTERLTGPTHLELDSLKTEWQLFRST